MKSEPLFIPKEDLSPRRDMADQENFQNDEMTEPESNWISEFEFEELLFPTLFFFMIVSSMILGIALQCLFEILTELHQLINTIWNGRMDLINNFITMTL